MICPKCGAQLSDDAKFCGVCGNTMAQNNANPVPPQQPVNDTMNQGAPQGNFNQNNAAPQGGFNPNNGAPQSGFNPNNGAPQGGFNPNNAAPQNGFDASQTDNKGSNALTDHLGQIIVGAAAVVALILIICICKALFGGGYKSPIKAQIKYMNKRSTDIEDYYESQGSYGKAASEYRMLLSKLQADANDKDEDEWEEDFTDNREDYYDDMDDTYGDDWKISYEIKKATKLSDSKIDDWQDSWEDYVDSCEDYVDSLEDNDDYDEDDVDKLAKLVEKMGDKEVTKGYKVKVRLEIKGDDDDDKETTEYYVLKIGGDWVLAN